MPVTKETITMCAVGNVFIWLLLVAIVWPDLMQGDLKKTFSAVGIGIIVTLTTAISILLGEEPY